MISFAILLLLAQAGAHVPALEVGITGEERGVKIDVHYGNRKTQAAFDRQPLASSHSRRGVVPS